MLAWTWLLACVVEEVTVDTGGNDTGDVDAEVDAPPDRPRPTEPSDETTEPVGGTGTSMDPSAADPGDDLLAFVVSDEADLGRVVAIDLYGAPDVTVGPWTARSADELVVSLTVSASSPAGELSVVLELDDGSVLRIDEPFLVR